MNKEKNLAQYFAFRLWINKLLELHRLIHEYKDNDEIDKEEFYLNKYYELYDFLIRSYGENTVNFELIRIAEQKKEILKNERFKKNTN